jgi:hypothetical protein
VRDQFRTAYTTLTNDRGLRPRLQALSKDLSKTTCRLAPQERTPQGPSGRFWVGEGWIVYVVTLWSGRTTLKLHDHSDSQVHRNLNTFWIQSGFWLENS